MHNHSLREAIEHLQDGDKASAAVELDKVEGEWPAALFVEAILKEAGWSGSPLGSVEEDED